MSVSINIGKTAKHRMVYSVKVFDSNPREALKTVFRMIKRTEKRLPKLVPSI